ncbi:MAG: tRNA (adenosine(37)-N6)-threonylcarbamoyltransferase complex transferase subunit TsaD [Desulfobacterales bacterium]|nr:tRNA (adenosine(37)-N6)-threonylcarbamoyltransferase complex transferase subunit TsaD [Desulfobacterales bacterium]
MYILGIESSCDETAAAVVQNGTAVLSSTISSQMEVHHRYGGVVPELASRKHIEAIVPVVAEAISDSGLKIRQIDAMAVTRGPGLVGALLVGFSFAKAYAYGLGVPLVGVNHLEAHINSVFLEPDPPPFPFVALLASGGHTGIYYVTSHTAIELMGQTRDDAAGEAFDKVAKLLGLGYPGGGVIDRLAKDGDPQQIAFTRPYLNKADFDFSFSGIKTAVRHYVDKHRADVNSRIADIAAGFQAAVVEVLAYKLIHAARIKDCEHIAVVGGVAANSGLRQTVRRDADRRGLKVHIPAVNLCGDNAAMIAATGFHYLKAGMQVRLSDDVFSRSR